jgi:hypothetical protein
MAPRKNVQSWHRLQWSNTQLTRCTDSIQRWRIWECLFLYNSILHEKAPPVQWLLTIQHRNKTYPLFQYSETNVMHFLFSLLRIKGLCMFRALLAHPQEALHKRRLVYCVRVMSVGCYQGWSKTPQPTDMTRTQYTKRRLCSASWGWASNARNMQRPLILNKLNKKCITLVSLYWYTMTHGQQNIFFSFLETRRCLLKIRLGMKCVRYSC